MNTTVHTPVWTPTKEAALRARYASDSISVLAAEFGVTEHAVRSKARKMDLNRSRLDAWRPEDDAVLHAYYRTHTTAQLTALLPARTYDAVAARLGVLGLAKRPLWTPKEDADLTRLYAEGTGATVLVEYFNRTIGAIARRATELGIRRPVAPKVWTPDRCEYLRLHYTTKSNPAIARHLGLSTDAVARQAVKMGLRKPKDLALESQLLTKRVKSKVKAQAAAEPKPDYRAEKRKPCGLERRAGTAKVKPAEPAKKWYTYPRGSAEYKAGEAAYFAGKQAQRVTDNYGRPATIYTNSSNAIGRR